MNNRNVKNGLLVTFEGIDGSGKSTQATMLLHRLTKEGYDALLVREPGGTDISEKIRDVLLDIRHQNMADTTELLLYAASRAQLVAEKIEPHLARNVVVICDRYTDSTMAYQGYGRQINTEFIRNLNALATQEIIPDLTFIIDVELEIAKNRQSNGPTDRLEMEKAEFKKRVRDGYRQIAKDEPDRAHILSGTRSIDELHSDIWTLTQQNIQSLTKQRTES
ncbi:MAG: dTMP kinase [Candidatus Marinimicrobia bacterium]|nr:dTMP kinase [Candidatus Neomarinimicrobiota bacterium]MCF7828266.1 dTMP kinase [Candidatus Neomarinimicrobiota bacterium]MCF7879559.1 dTMP kinase [Candidatus Neomarinimicrobiota bacterium]